MVSVEEGTARSWYDSARSNFESIRKRHGRMDPCSLVEHYTDVVAEATAAEALSPHGSPMLKQADKLRRTATHAQRGAVIACRGGVRRGR